MVHTGTSDSRTTRISSSPLNILLIGGSGFVSGTLAQTAVRAGHRVWALTRGKRPLPAGVTGLTADRRDFSTFERVIRDVKTGWDLVVDCIGYEVEDARQDLSVFAGRARHLVFISTDFVFDPDARRLPRNRPPVSYVEDGYGGKKRLCELELVNRGTASLAWTILRPTHIYGPGSLLGCLPLHSRDPDLIEKLKSGAPLKLAGGGHFLQQPVTASDLAGVALSCAGNPRTVGKIYEVAGPDIIESRAFYLIAAEILSVDVEVIEIPVQEILREHPEQAPFLCHRFYDLEALHRDGLEVPGTPIEEGLRQHVMGLMERR